MSRLLVVMTGLVSAAALAVTPVNGTTPTLTPVTINASAGDQFDPHVSGDYAAYTDGLGIRYYNFPTAADAAIPMGGGVRDLLSDVSGSKIVFSRVTVGVGTSVMVFDAATAGPAIEINPAPGTTRMGAAIGGNSVAYVDFGVQPNGELLVTDLSTSLSTRITNDTAIDGNPSVSPAGNVVVWEHCGSSLTNCDIYQAVKSGATWSTSIVSDSLSPEGNPDTNGTLVVYDSQRGSNPDIFWRPVIGGAEVQLALPGLEGNPSIAGDYIAFESRASLVDSADIFVYDLVTNKLYQITNTPLVNEQLNDITMLPDGHLRVVWASDEDGFDQRNIKGATFLLRAVVVPPPPPTDGGCGSGHQHEDGDDDGEHDDDGDGHSDGDHDHHHGHHGGSHHNGINGDDDDQGHDGTHCGSGNHGNGSGSGGGSSGHRHDDLSGTPDSAPGPQGCSSAGGAPTALMLLAVAAWFLLQRKVAALAHARSRR